MYKIDKKTSTHNSKRILILIGAATLVLIAAIIVFLVFKEDTPPASPDAKYPVTQNNANAPTNPNTDTSTTTDKPIQGNIVAQPDDQISIAQEGGIVISELGQSDGYVNAKASVTNFTLAKCVYSFSNPDARPVVRETVKDCSGISIPEVEFEILGTYTLTVTAYGENDKLIATKDIIIL